MERTHAPTFSTGKGATPAHYRPQVGHAPCGKTSILIVGCLLGIGSVALELVGLFGRKQRNVVSQCCSMVVLGKESPAFWFSLCWTLNCREKLKDVEGWKLLTTAKVNWSKLFLSLDIFSVSVQLVEQPWKGFARVAALSCPLSGH